MLKSAATRKQERLEHLAQIHALSRAMASAISAIEKNDLQQFQSHLAVQETICNRLSANAAGFSSVATENEVTGENPDATLQKEIVKAHVALAQLNRVYAALLKRSSKTVATLIALYRSDGEGYNRGLSSLPQCHSWSCEV